MPMTNVVIKALLERGYEVLLVGYPSQMSFKDSPEGLYNTTERNYNFRQSAAALHTCDAILSPDSASAHLAAAMDIPCVTLFGPIDARLRISGTRVRAMQGEAPCAPCNYHPAHANDFPAGQPCGKLGACLALTSITPDEIVGQLTELTSSGIITP
jgi:ADP-heptose:LPS heptosyltransferase